MPIEIKVGLNDKNFRRMIVEAAARKASVKVGVLSSKGGDEKHPGSDLSMVEIAAIHEFGSPAANIPERSFIRSSFAPGSGLHELTEFTKKLGRALYAEKIFLRQALEALGAWGVARVQATMSKGVPPPLAPSTLARRAKVQTGAAGRDVPLIDTGRLRQSIAYEVEGI